jgi:hypothetical protein
MGKLIGINIENRRFLVGQLAFNEKINKFIMAQEILFQSFQGNQSKILESDYFLPEEVTSVETYCKPGSNITWEESLNNNHRQWGRLQQSYYNFRNSSLLPEFKL